jgi:hypothetical protein
VKEITPMIGRIANPSYGIAKRLRIFRAGAKVGPRVNLAWHTGCTKSGPFSEIAMIFTYLLLLVPASLILAYLVPVHGHSHDLVFANPLELIAIAAVAFVVSAIAHDGETTWFEGVMLLSVYAILALAFFFATP